MSKLRDMAPSQIEANTVPRGIDPLNDRTLLNYYHDVYRWHGFIRFAGVPNLRDERPVPIQKVFIEPRMARQYLRPEAMSDSIEAESLADAILGNEKLVLLGDPGAGKSTLVKWIAWQLSTPPHPELAGLRRHVPVPVILRELDLSAVKDAATLLQAALDHPSMRQLKEYDRLDELLGGGQALFLFDGLDEIPRAYRPAVGAAIRDAITQYSRCRWLITSRVIGYADFALDRPAGESARGLPQEPQPETRLMTVRYVVPLSDEQISTFALRWFEMREETVERARDKASQFVAALGRDEPTKQLARLPNLLTLMALTFQGASSLPHGRALLYDKIAEAYLETIEASKQMSWAGLSLADKKRGLAYVAFEMQRSDDRDVEGGGRREILVSGDRWLELFTQAVGETQARQFLDFVRDRSGIVQQRGANHYGFAHLSLQDYFVGLYLAERLTSPRWLRGQSDNGTSPDDLRGYFEDDDWREALLLLFEILAQRSEWADTVLTELFGEDLETADDPKSLSVVASLAVDPYSGLTQDVRQRVIKRAWEFELSQQSKISFSYDSSILRALGSASGDCAQITWQLLSDSLEKRQPTGLALNRCAALVELSDIRFPESLRYLYLRDTNVRDLSPLTKLPQLVILDIAGTPVVELLPVHESLTTLWAEDSELQELSGLRPDRAVNIDVSRSRVNPEAFGRLTRLQSLYANGLPFESLSVIQNLSSLKNLSLADTPLRSVAGVEKLLELKSLFLTNTGVDDVAPLRFLKKLETLSIMGTQVTDISVLRDLPALEKLWISNTGIQDISPLLSLTELETVWLPSSVSQADRARLRARFPKMEIY